MSAVKAEYRNGKVVLPRDMPKHTDCKVTVLFPDDGPCLTLGDDERFRRSAGAWRGIVDCDRLKEEIYRSRRDIKRREPKL